MLRDYCQKIQDVLPVGDKLLTKDIYRRAGKAEVYSNKYDCKVRIGVNDYLRHKSYNFQNIIDKTAYVQTLLPKGDKLLSTVTRATQRIKVYSKSYDCEMSISLSHYLNTYGYDFRNVIDKTTYVKKFIPPEYTLLDEVKSATQTVRIDLGDRVIERRVSRLIVRKTFHNFRFKC